MRLKALVIDSAAVGLLLFTGNQRAEVQIAAGLGSMGLAMIAHDETKRKRLEDRSNRMRAYHQGLVKFHEMVTPASTQPALAESTSPALNSSPLTELSVNGAKYPHVLIIGKTGAGKSTIAQGLAAVSPGKRFAIAPHLDPAKLDEEWRSCHGVFCGGRNYGTEEDEPIAYDDLINNRVPNASAFQVLKALHDEMDRRYRDPAGFDSHEQHDWFLDETPAIAKNLDKWFGKLVSPQAYEARKVKLRLWIITQNDNVKAMKLEGEGRVRDNFTYLYLGDQAKRRLRYLVSKQIRPESELEASYKRLAVVDEIPCEVPDKEVLEARIEGNSPANRFVQFYSGEVVLPETPKPIPKTWDEFSQHWDIYDQLMTWGLDNGKTKRVIVETLWGYKGKNYSTGCEFYDRMIPQTIEA